MNEILLCASVFLFFAFWVVRLERMFSLRRIVRMRNNIGALYVPGYDLFFNCLASDEPEKRLSDLLERKKWEKFLVWVYVFLILCAIPYFGYEVLQGCGYLVSLWYIGILSFEYVFSGLVHTLKERAYLVLRQCEEDRILSRKDISCEEKLEIIREKRCERISRG